MKNNAMKLAALACAAALCLALAACAPAAPTTGGAAEGDSTAQMADTGAGDGMYESDEQCLSCHGGSYEALAATTADYGLSNPHDSIHGGPVSCVNCHAKDKEVTDNQCDNCHAWPHNPETGPGTAL